MAAGSSLGLVGSTSSRDLLIDQHSITSENDIDMEVFGGDSSFGLSPKIKSQAAVVDEATADVKLHWFKRMIQYLADTNRPLSKEKVRKYAAFLPTFRYWQLLWFFPYIVVTGIVPITLYSLPLQPYTAGFYENWLFAFVVVPLTTFFGFFMVRPFLVMHQPQYEFNAHFLVSPLVGAAMSVLFSSLMGHFGVFPAPLGAYTIVLPGVVTTSICEFFLLQSKYRETLPQLKIFACILLTEAAFINFNTVYVLYRVLSMQMDPSSQAIFACLLPVIKFTLIQILRPLVEYVDRSLLPASAYFVELYHTLFYAVLFTDSPSPVTFVVMIVGDIVPWLLFLFRVNRSRSDRHWDEAIDEGAFAHGKERPAMAAGLDLPSARVVKPRAGKSQRKSKHVDASPDDDVDVARGSSIDGISLASISAPPSPMFPAVSLDAAAAEKGISNPITAAMASAPNLFPDLTTRRSGVQRPVVLQGGASAVSVPSKSGTPAELPPLVSENGTEWTESRAARAAADPTLTYAYAGVFETIETEDSSPQPDQAHLVHLMQPRERRVLFVTSHAFVSFVLQTMVPVQVMVFFAIIYNFADRSNFFFVEDMDDQSYNLALIYNGVLIGVHLLIAAATLPLIYARLRVNFFAYGVFFFKEHLTYFMTAHITVLTIVFGLSLKHYGDDFTFQFDWL